MMQFFNESINLLDKRDKNKEKQPSVIKEFIKAKYNKLCPRITWTKTE